MHVDASMLSMMDFVVSYDGIRSSTDLNARESVAINIVMFDESTAFAEDVHAALMAIVNLILAYGWV